MVKLQIQVYNPSLEAILKIKSIKNDKNMSLRFTHKGNKLSLQNFQEPSSNNLKNDENWVLDKKKIKFYTNVSCPYQMWAPSHEYNDQHDPTPLNSIKPLHLQ